MRILIVGSSLFLTFSMLITGCVSSTGSASQQRAESTNTEPAKATVLTTKPTPTLETTQTTDNSKPQTTIAKNPERCQTSQLSVRRISQDAGVGNIALTYAFTNNASKPCTLYGYPGVELLDAKDQPLVGVKVIRSENTYFANQQSRQKIILQPKAEASFQIAYNHIPTEGQSCLTSSKIEITPPNAYEHFTLTERINPCTGKVKVTPVQVVSTQR